MQQLPLVPLSWMPGISPLSLWDKPIMTFLGLSMTMKMLNAYFLKDYGEYFLNMSGDVSMPSEISFVYQGQTLSQSLPQTFPSLHSQKVYTSRSRRREFFGNK